MNPVSVLACMLAAVPMANLGAQEIMSIDAGRVYWIDPHDGSVVRTGQAVGNQGAWSGMARDSSGRVVGSSGYTWLPFAIYEIHPVTGQTQFICQTGLLGLTSISFGPGDALYGLNNPNGSGLGILDLVQIDLSTGATTVVGSTGFNTCGTLAYGQGFFWAYESGYDGVGLIRIDPLTGLGTDVNPSLRGPNDLVDSICFSDDGVLYLLDFGLWIMDTVTGVPAFVGHIPGAPLITCAEFVPHLPSPFALGVRGETGGPMGVFASGATPGATVALLHGYGLGGPTAVGAGLPCAGTLLNLNAPVRLLRTFTADAAGKVDYGPAYVPPQVRGRVRLQALDLATCATSNVARLMW